MPNLTTDQLRITNLLSYHVDEIISDSEKVELQELLRKDESLRKFAARWLVDEFLLDQEQQASLASQFFQGSGMLPGMGGDRVPDLGRSSLGETTHLEVEDKTTTLNKWGSKARATAVMATCATLAIAAAFLWQKSDTYFSDVAKQNSVEALENGEVEESYRTQYAVLTRAVGVTWSDDHNSKVPNESSSQVSARKVGATLGGERLRFSTGAIQLEFCSGATVVIEGPADFEILSPMRAICHSGKMRAHAPPQAHGFLVSVPGMDVEDLGTEFAIQVDGEGLSEVHVLEGEVLLHPESLTDSEDKIKQSLVDGESVRFDQVAGLRQASADLNNEAWRQFIGSEKIASLAEAEGQTRLQMWQEHERFLTNDPETIVHYDFQRDHDWSRTLMNRSPLQDPGVDGAVVGCRWSTGRWPKSESLDFKGTSDRVRINIPGEYESLTYMAWIRIDGLDRIKNSLVLTDEWQRGESHWQLSADCELILGVSSGFRSQRPAGDPFQGHDYISPKLLGREDLGRWVFLTTVYDAETAEIRHYFDGQRRSTHEIRNVQTLRFGPTSIGSWTSGVQDHYPVRAFNGRMDELTILARPLSDEEIFRTFELGSP